MVGSSCVVRRVDALQKPTWPSIDSGGAAVLNTWQRGFEDLSNGCGTCGGIGRYDALAVGRSAASAIGAKGIRPRMYPCMYPIRTLLRSHRYRSGVDIFPLETPSVIIGVE